MLQAYHIPLFHQLHIPWCIHRLKHSEATSRNIRKALFIDFYCPWDGCSVFKRWNLFEGKILHSKQKSRAKGPINVVVNYMLSKFKKETIFKECSEELLCESYIVVEILLGEIQHKHLKGTNGGSRSFIDESLKDLEEIKHYLRQMKDSSKGSLQALLKKGLQPIAQMAQALLNQPPESFLGGFTNIIPHSLACYQKDNSEMKRKLIQQYHILAGRNDGIVSQVTKTMG